MNIVKRTYTAYTIKLSIKQRSKAKEKEKKR